MKENKRIRAYNFPLDPTDPKLQEPLLPPLQVEKRYPTSGDSLSKKNTVGRKINMRVK